MENWEELYKQWIRRGNLEDNAIPYIQRSTPDIELLSEFLANKVDNCKDMGDVLEVVNFVNCLLSKHSSIGGSLQNFIKALIEKLNFLTKIIGGAYINIEVGNTITISLTFQTNDIKTK